MQLATLLIISCSLLVLWYIWLLFAIRPQKQRTNIEQLPGVSVIVCAHNENENLKKNLSSVLNQDYHPFEVIVVNHCSTDDSASYLYARCKMDEHLRVLNLSDTTTLAQGKRAALALGLEQAQYEYVLVTDADCEPDTGWLKNMTTSIAQSEIVLGYAPFQNEKHLASQFMQFENFMTAALCFGYASMGIPYMGVGRNLMYKRSIAARLNASAVENLLSGDDDLLVNETAHSGNTVYNLNSASFVYSPHARGIAAWLRQKSRHLQAGLHYSIKSKFLLSAFYVTHLAFYTSLLLLITTNQFWFAFTVFLLKAMVQYLTHYFVMKKLNVLHLLWGLPIFEIAYIFYYFAVAPVLLIFNKPAKWK